MKGFTAIVVAITALAGSSLAAPTVEERQTYAACSGLYGSAQCCATDVLGVADLDCGERKFSHPYISRHALVALANISISSRGLHFRR